MSKYPIPSYAATIWVTGDNIWLSFPSPIEGARNHSVPFPNNEIGLRVALETLREREKNVLSTIGTKGAPCRRQVEDQVKADKRYNEILRTMAETKKVSEAEKAEAAAFLEELGL